MSDRPKKVKPLETCHNPAGCTNTCRPGHNFCDPCREFFGMKGAKTTTPLRGRYQHPLIGVGDAAQTHLKQEETKSMDEAKEQATTDKNKLTSEALKKRYADSPREGVFFDGFIRGWIKEEAKKSGMTFQQFVKASVWEKVPAEIIKAGMLADLRRKGK